MYKPMGCSCTGRTPNLYFLLHVCVSLWARKGSFIVTQDRMGQNGLEVVEWTSWCDTFSRGLWTWQSWVIYAPAFNHKIGNAAHCGVSEVLLFTTSYKWKKQQWKKWTLLMISNGAPIQDGCEHNRNLNFSVWPDNGLAIPCYFLAAFPSLKVS